MNGLRDAREGNDVVTINREGDYTYISKREAVLAARVKHSLAQLCIIERKDERELDALNTLHGAIMQVRQVPFNTCCLR